MEVLNLRSNDLEGACELSNQGGMAQFTAPSSRICLLAGELPLAIGRLKANGCGVDLRDNKGFTLSNDISAVADATKLDFSNCYLTGAFGMAVTPTAPAEN